ncbi:MAG: hypothetical protein WD271_05900 [Acidimicrobiia bacterium]
MSEPESARGAGFWIALVVGWAVIAFGALQLIGQKTGLSGATQVATWVVAGHAVHDLLIAPLVCLIGIGIASLLAEPWRTPIRSGVIASVLVVAVAYPALRGYGRKPNNPTVHPHPYTTGVLTVLGVVWGLVAVWIAVRIVRAYAGTRRERPRQVSGVHRNFGG